MIKIDDREVYPVGLLRDIKYFWSARKYYRLRGQSSCRIFLTRFNIHKKQRNYYNGYLAEPYEWPTGVTKCGHAWTKRRAVAKLNKYCALAGVDERYVYEETDD